MTPKEQTVTRGKGKGKLASEFFDTITSSPFASRVAVNFRPFLWLSVDNSRVASHEKDRRWPRSSAPLVPALVLNASQYSLDLPVLSHRAYTDLAMPYSAAPSTAVHSRGRNCRGAEWHKKGYRDMGCIWINMKRLCYDRPFTRGRDVSEHWDVGKLCNDLIREYIVSVRQTRISSTSLRS